MSVSLYGNYTRKLFQVWCERAESANKLSYQAVPFTFHAIDIFPTSSQVHEMLQCASECSNRQNGEYLTFGEFCVFASELKSCYDKRIPRPIPLSKCPKDRQRLHSRRRSSLPMQKPSKYEVFLGGSCNPTTWRTDIAIPMLKKIGITYYNPQVAHWGPELMEMENQAKQNAEIMFFVIDNQTRSVASMIEAAHIAGTDRKLILVIHEFEGNEIKVMGERLTEKELKDLKQGQRFLQDLVERKGIPVFRNIPNALTCAARLIREKIYPQDLNVNDIANPIKMPYVHLGDKLMKLREVFDDLDSANLGEISLEDVCMAYKILTCQELTMSTLKSKVAHQNNSLINHFEMDKINPQDIKVNFDQFCCIMMEFRSQMDNGPKMLEDVASKASDIFCSLLQPMVKLVDWILPRHNSETDDFSDNYQFAASCRDIYLGGSGFPSTWREKVAIPLLKKHGLTYFSPQEEPWNKRLIPLEAAAMENSRILLFVITKDTRSLAQMTIAGHYVGFGCQMVLCIQYLEDNVEINGEKLSNQAVKDYNRGRVYLSDLANRAGIPVFEDLEEAVNCAAQKCLSSS
ncbi:uncharacterized protein raw [Centruroides vittatus]|uniref:uncharacterized protein raw n=1 Tax=Centruroides vittatus TaxID=120091 RepID=UPI00350FE300